MLTVDSINGAIARCVDNDSGKTVELSLVILPLEVKEGDILEETDRGYRICTGKTAFRRQEMKAKMDRLFKR